MTPARKREKLNELLRRFACSLHLPVERRYTAKAIADLIDENPWLNDQIPHDVAGIVRKTVRRNG